MYQSDSRQVGWLHSFFFFIISGQKDRIISKILFCCRFICFEDREWFDKTIGFVIQEHVDSSLVSGLHPEPYFVDFLRAAPEPTGEEDDDACFDAPKVYELV